ncbi:unnamed protein product [Mytilus edulis]|uniref:SGNH hydrolase-type esterase domain-containing protein n=1 Tax=Mytilus edulis TaxID=6550 RepID=A0A8S3R7U2_MYTED|nr:unnamed protein product [Mytilus edulis]
MAPRGNQNIIASNQNQSDRAELDPVTVAIPGPSSSRVPMSSTDSQRPELYDVATTIHRRAADNDSSIVSQVEMVPSIQDSHVEENLRCYPPPQILIIHLGSNDLGLIKEKELIEQIRLDIMRLHVLLPNLSLVWSEILPRRYWHLAKNQVAINSTRKRVNAAVQYIQEELNHGLVICHPNIKAQDRDLFRLDGVHLSDVGNDVFLNNVQGALELFASSDRRVFPN